MSRKLLLVAAVGAFALGLPVMSAAPVQAAWKDCGNGYVCLWGNNTYSGDPWFEKSATGGYNTGYWDNDETSSVANRSGVSSAYLYDDTNQSATHGWVACLGNTQRQISTTRALSSTTASHQSGSPRVRA